MKAHAALALLAFLSGCVGYVDDIGLWLGGSVEEKGECGFRHSKFTTYWTDEFGDSCPPFDAGQLVCRNSLPERSNGCSIEIWLVCDLREGSDFAVADVRLQPLDDDFSGWASVDWRHGEGQTPFCSSSYLTTWSRSNNQR